MKTVKKLEVLITSEEKKQRVAGYARVSHSELLQSLSEQVSYYSSFIQSNTKWEYAGMYIDKAVSGRNIKKRKAYQRLIEDCREGKIDIILTKSISRFGRNTLDLLETIRELRELNVSVRFEKENIDTLAAEGELLITLLATMAEEESKSISSNIRWKVKKKFEQGLPYNPQAMLGYRWNKDHYKIYEPEAEVIRRVYRLYLSGLTPTKIADILNKEGRKTRKGNNYSRAVIHRILLQEAYTGILILQKTYHKAEKGKSVLNKGERVKYIVENAHEAIISQEIFDEVQKRKKKNNLFNKRVGKNYEKNNNNRS